MSDRIFQVSEKALIGMRYLQYLAGIKDGMVRAAKHLQEGGDWIPLKEAVALTDLDLMRMKEVEDERRNGS